MNRRSLEVVVFAVLLVTGAWLRVYLRDLPNVAPVAAIALFGGYFFRKKGNGTSVAAGDNVYQRPLDWWLTIG